MIRLLDFEAKRRHGETLNIIPVIFVYYLYVAVHITAQHDIAASILWLSNIWVQLPVITLLVEKMTKVMVEI